MDRFDYKESQFSLLLYGLLILITAYFGSLTLTKTYNNDFYVNFMLKWKHIMLDYQYSGIPLPELNKQNPMAYMKQLSAIIANKDLADSSPDFIHKIKLANGDISRVFLVARTDVLHIYGLDKKMVDNLDKMIDQKNNLAKGHWLAFPDKNQLKYHAIWFYKKS